MKGRFWVRGGQWESCVGVTELSPPAVCMGCSADGLVRVLWPHHNNKGGGMGGCFIKAVDWDLGYLALVPSFVTDSGQPRANDLISLHLCSSSSEMTVPHPCGLSACMV